MTGPLLTLAEHDKLVAAAKRGDSTVECSLDLGRSRTTVEIVDSTSWRWQGQQFQFLERCKDRTIYYWAGEGFEPASRFSGALIKLVPTEWGPPTFEIDGVKMLPTSQVSPYEDARAKVALIQPSGKAILDTCAGLGYFAAWCLAGGAARIVSFEKNPDVFWLRSLNPWSPGLDARLELQQCDVAERIASLRDASFDAVLHDPPRFGLAGELYSQAFYDHLARVLRPGGRLFHYTGAPNRLTSNRDVPNEVSKRLRLAGFVTELSGDGVLATRRRPASHR